MYANEIQSKTLAYIQICEYRTKEDLLSLALTCKHAVQLFLVFDGTLPCLRLPGVRDVKRRWLLCTEQRESN